MCHLQFGVHRGKVCFWDFMIFGLGIKKLIFGPPVPLSPPPPHHCNGNLGFYDFWTQHQKVIFGPPPPPPTVMGIWDFIIFGLSIKSNFWTPPPPLPPPPPL